LVGVGSHEVQGSLVVRLRAAGCVFAEDEARLLAEAAQSPDDLARMVDLRVAGHPLEQVLGWAEFYGLRVAVAPGVFVPRRRTELLVEQAAALGRELARPPVVVDLCCGTGSVGRALAAVLGRVELHAVDVDPAAVACACTNLAGIGWVYQGDLDQPLPASLAGRVDLLVANAPYVPTGSFHLLPPEARLHEPRVALDGGRDGLAVQRRVVEAAPRWLRPGGHLLIETSRPQSPALVASVEDHGFSARVADSEECGATVVIGAWPPR
jgi:release factor glutamine methyltransferase